MDIQRTPLALAIVFLLVACSGLRGGEQTAATEPPYTAVVSPTEARFVFPVSAREVWQWNSSAIRDNVQEYQWQVRVDDRGRTGSFGYALVKLPGADPAQGSLAELLRAGETGVWRPGNPSTKIESTGVRVEPGADGQLVVRITDPATLDRWFSARPDSVTFVSQLPAQLTPYTRRAPVTYSGGPPAREER